jgi:hypothetical protein
MNVPSSKNSKQWTGKYLVDSKLVQKYKKCTHEYWDKYAVQFSAAYELLDKPVVIAFTFYRDSRRPFDYINPAQTVQDLMVTYGWLPDDNANYIVPYFERYQYNKENPGVEITLKLPAL